MSEEMIWKQASLVRNATLRGFEGLTEEQANVVPDGWNNNIRWNLGHVLNSVDSMLHRLAGCPKQLPEAFAAAYGGKTKPADWSGTPHTLDELKAMLAEQPAKVKAQLSGRLEEPLLAAFPPIGEGASVGDLVLFSLYHEGTHNGVISGIRKAIAHQQGTGAGSH